ncbi:hypothetical protein [Spiroplasma endosymbiont of Tipula paludosa]|uniref:hypothetical protein n=1 Tax=Spiroplasma endosymbiont of Tipula paludosa TaxID=3066295 RepID=UPI0035C917B0
MARSCWRLLLFSIFKLLFQWKVLKTASATAGPHHFGVFWATSGAAIILSFVFELHGHQDFLSKLLLWTIVVGGLTVKVTFFQLQDWYSVAPQEPVTFIVAEELVFLKTVNLSIDLVHNYN